MKLTKKNLIKLLEAMSRNAYKCSKTFKNDGNRHMEDMLFSESMAYDHIIQLLSSEDYFSSTCEIFQGSMK